MKFHFILVIMISLFVLTSCHRQGSTIVSDYTYAGTSYARWENSLTTTIGTNTMAWDSSYQDKVWVHRDIQDSLITFKLSYQSHLCQSFQQEFTFPTNNLNVYTANATYPNAQASHTFEINNDSLNAYMLKYDGVDSNHTVYELRFKGRLIQ